MLIDPKQIVGGMAKQVGTGVGMIQPKQIRPLPPTIVSIEDKTQSTGSVVIYDSMLITATTSDSLDFRTTTGVSLYDNSGATLIGQLSQGPAGTWTLLFALGNTAGAHNFLVRRFFAGGSTDSTIDTINVLDQLRPDQWTTATVLAWFRNPESLQWATTLFGISSAARTITVSAISGLNGRTEGLLVKISTTGAPNVGTFDISIDNGHSFLATGVTIPSGAGTYNVPTTDITLTFQQAVSYTNGDQYFPTIQKWLDKIGAFPNSTNNLINDASNGGTASRPRPISVAFQNANVPALGAAPAMRIDAALGAQALMWNTAGSIATALSGTAKKFGIFGATKIQQADIPSVGGTRKDFYCFSNLTDVDQPRISIGTSLLTTDVVATLRTTTLTDTGGNTSNSSGANVFQGCYLLEDSRNGSGLRSVSMNAANFLGGDSGIVADESGLTVTTTRFTLGTTQTQSGKTNGSSVDWSELVITDGPLSEIESWQARAYFLNQYPHSAPNIGFMRWRAAADVLEGTSSWDAWAQGDMTNFGVATTMVTDGAPSQLTLNYGYRAPRTSANAAYPNNWYTLFTGNPTAEQAVFDDQEMMLGEVGSFRWFLTYPDRADMSVGPIPNVCDIYDNSLGHYLPSPNRGLSNFALMVFSFWASFPNGLWQNYPAHVARWVSLMQEPGYQFVITADGVRRPLMGLYSDVADGTQWENNLSRVTTLTNAVIAAGMNAPAYCYMTGGVAASNTIGCQLITRYVPLDPVGHDAWTPAHVNNCKSVSNLGANATRCMYISHCFDDRPRNAANPWVDLPTYTEIEQLQRDQFASARSAQFINPSCIIHQNSASEIDESMVFFPSEQTLQESVNSPPRGIFLDAMKNVRTRTFPATYTDAFLAWNIGTESGGSIPGGWSLVQGLSGPSGGLTGSDQYAVLRNTTTTTPKTWSTKTDRYQVFATLGPGLGHIGITLDGGVQLDINQDDGGGTTRYSQPVYDSGVLSNAAHTLAVARISGQAEFSKVRAHRSR